jgi:hypothetical protein
VLYTVRAERLLIERLVYNLLFRWFVGLNMDIQPRGTSVRQQERYFKARSVIKLADKESAGHCNFHYGAMRPMKPTAYKLLKQLVGASGFEPEASCAQGSGRNAI